MSQAKITTVKKNNREPVLSHNVLYISYLMIDMKPELSFGRMEMHLWRSVMKLELQYYCPITKIKFQWYTFSFEGRGYDTKEAIRDCLQQFLNGDFRSGECAMEDTMHKVDKLSRELHHVEYSHIPEPYYSLLQQIFSSDMWDIDKLQLTA